MAFNTRIFGYRGISQIPQLNAKQYTADAVFVLDEPIVFGQTIVTDVVAVTSAANADLGTKILRVEVPSGEAIRYRIIPAGWPVVAADTDCPYLSGLNNFTFAPNWRISLIDARNLT